MSGEALFVVITVGVHLVGLLVLVWAIAGREALDLFRTDDGGGPGSSPQPRPEAPGGTEGPLPDALPARVRLREPARIADAYPAPARRPTHRPAPARPRQPARRG